MRKYDSQGNEFWALRFGTPEKDGGIAEVEDAVIDSEGNLYVVGSTDGTLTGQSSPVGIHDSDAFARKYNRNGNELWTRQFGTKGSDVALGAVPGGGGSLYVVGWTEGAFPGQSKSGLSDGFVRKYDGEGNELWTRQLGTQSADRIHGAGLESAGNLYVVGQTFGALPGHTSAGRSDAFIRKYTSNGDELWTRQFGTRNLDSALSVVLDDAGSLNIVGWTEGALPDHANSGGSDAFVVKMSDVHGDN